jgi:hypothetical protein
VSSDTGGGGSKRSGRDRQGKLHSESTWRDARCTMFEGRGLAMDGTWPVAWARKSMAVVTALDFHGMATRVAFLICPDATFLVLNVE